MEDTLSFVMKWSFSFFLLSLFGCSWLTVSVCDLCAFFLDVWREEVGSLWEGMTTFMEQLSCLVVLSSEHILVSRPSLVTTSPRGDSTHTDLR